MLLAAIGCWAFGTAGAGPRDYALTPVLFVHGAGLHAGTWDTLVAHLSRNGYPDEYLLAIDMQPRTGSNPRAARQFIGPGVRTLLASANRAGATARGHGGHQRVDIVAHSMGAFAARWYVARDGATWVRRLVTLAGANHGTDALCGLDGAGAREMCPAYDVDRNGVQFALNGAPGGRRDETPFGTGRDPDGVDPVAPDERRRIHYLTLRIEPDRWIKPEHSATLRGAGGIDLAVPPGLAVRETTPGNFLLLADVEHDPMLRHPQVLRFVAFALGRP